MQKFDLKLNYFLFHFKALQFMHYYIILVRFWWKKRSLPPQMHVKGDLVVNFTSPFDTVKKNLIQDRSCKLDKSIYVTFLY